MTTCATCRSFRPIKINGPVDLANKERPDGTCQRNPPQVNLIPIQTPRGLQVIQRSDWPEVKRSDDCSAWQVKVMA